jgi:acyl carrier protein
MVINMKIEDEVTRIVGKNIGVPVSLDAKKVDFDSWDSISSIGILFDLEESFLVTFTNEEMESMVSVLKICDILKSKGL